MKIIILFATYNGAERLPKMLEALERLNYPSGQWSIIAVDNNSTDSTRDVLEQWKERLPLTCLCETRQGKSHAMNTGLDHVPADTDLVILSDDDIIADPDWLNAFKNAAETHSDYNIFGGEIRPAWEQEPPQWILDWVDIRMVFAVNEGTAEGEINPDLVFGPNSAFRAKLFLEEGHRFPTHIGPKTGASYPMGNDSALAQLLASHHHKAWHVPKAVVGHMIPARNMTEDWIVKRAERYGWGMVVLHPEWFEDYRRLSVRHIHHRLKYALFWLLQIPAGLLPQCERRYKLRYWYYYCKGMFKGLSLEKSA